MFERFEQGIARRKSVFSFPRFDNVYFWKAKSHSACPPLAMAVQVIQRRKLEEIKLIEMRIIDNQDLKKDIFK